MHIYIYIHIHIHIYIYIYIYGKESNQEHFKRIKSLKTKSLALLFTFRWGYLILNLLGSIHAHAIKLHEMSLKMMYKS